MAYEVGQVIYLLSKRDLKIFPVQVIEEIKRKTIEEEVVTYVVSLPDKEKTQVSIEDVNADIFTSLESLESHMIENAHSEIKVFIKKASRLASLFKSHVPDKSPLDEISIGRDDEKAMTSNEEDEKATVDLGNGLTAKIDLSHVEGLGVG